MKKRTVRQLLVLTVLTVQLFLCEAMAGAACPTTALRWASSSRTLYATGPVTCTLTDLDALAPADALQVVNAANKVWLLRANLVLQNGARLDLHGAAAGGDVNELRLLSNDSSSSYSVIFIRADWGMVDIASTKITSWDEVARGPDAKPNSNKRAFIHVRSRLDADGVTPHESTMNIRDSDVGYLGHYAAESYGLVWKVSGSGAGLYDKVNVRGNVTNSRIHHNYFGAYTYGAYGMLWDGNEIDHNVKYGLDPHDDSDSLVVTNNRFHDNGDHGFICSQRCDHLIVSDNESYNNKGNGFMLHRLVTASLVERNDAHGNTDSGVALFDSSGNTIRLNHLHDNRRGIRFSVGASDNFIEGNTIEGNSTYALYFYKGSDAPTSGDGHPRRNSLVGNRVSGNAMALKLELSDENTFADNTFASNANGFELTDGQGNAFRANTIPATSLILTKTSSLGLATTIITQAAAPLLVQASGAAITIFGETANHTHVVQGLSATTVVTPTEATLTLDRAQLSSARTVSAVQLYATPASGTLLLTPTTATAFSARSSSGTSSVQFQLGGLASSTSYTIRRNGVDFQAVSTSAEGVLEFTDGNVGTSTITYAIN